MFFIHPHYLWLLLLLVPLVWQHRRHRTSLGTASLWSVAGLRVLAVVALVVALARPVILHEDQKQTIVHLVDISAGVDQESLGTVVDEVEHAAKKAKKNERHKIILFAETPWQVASFKTLRKDVAARREKPSSASDLAAAIDLAATSVRDGVRGEVRLYSDGRATTGNTASAVRDLARRGMSLRTIVVGKPLTHELILSDVEAASAAMLGETLPILATFESTDPGVAQLVVTDMSGEEVLRNSISVKSGRQTIDLTLPLTQQGTVSFDVRLESKNDTLTSNNRKSFAVEVLPPYRIGLIGTSETDPLGKLLAPSAEVRTIDLDSLKKSTEKKATSRKPSLLSQYDLLVLADTPADSLGPGVMAEMNDVVKDGCGLLVTGGKRSFGPGGYLEGPLAEILPIRSIQKMEQRDPSTTLVIIIDTSGSMGAERVQLAKEIARLAISRLKPHDKAGVVEFYGSKRWAAPIQPASNAIDINRALNRLSSGGGTVILPAIEEAYFALLNVRTRTRHVLVLTDGGIETGAFEPLIRKMSDSGMTLSTVLVGPSTHSTFLTRLAQWGRGKSYHAPSRFNMPEILVKQPESSLLSPWVERTTPIVPVDHSVLTNAIDFGHAPDLTGYVETEARPTADILIRSMLDHPILVRWQYGLGHVATLTTQLSGTWSEDLASWDGYGPLVAGLTRSLIQRTQRMPILFRTTVGPEGVTILAESVTGRTIDSTASLELTATDSSGETVYRQTLEPIQPGKWLMRVSLASLGVSATSRGPKSRDTKKNQVGRETQKILHLEAKISTGIVSAGAVAVCASDEFYTIAPEKQLMADWEQSCHQELTRINKEQDTVASQAVSPMELRPTMISLALVLFFLQITLRRLLPSRRLRVASPKNLPPSTTTPSTTTPSATTILALFWAVVITATLVLTPTTAVAAEEKEKNVAAEVSEAVDEESTNAEPKAPVDRLPIDVVRKVQALYGSRDQKAARSFLKKAVDEAISSSKAAAESKANIASHAARLAWFCGDSETAAELLIPEAKGEEKKRCRDELLLGTLLLETAKPDVAIQHFQNAYDAARTSTDRRFAMAMQVHSARQAKTLDRLANEWLAAKVLPQEKLQVLVQILGELERHEDAFQLVERPDFSDELSENLQKEVVSLAIDAGKTDRAMDVYHQLLKKRPRYIPYLSAAARLHLLENRDGEAKQLFKDAIDATHVTKPKTLFQLAGAATELAMYDQANAALDKAGKASKTDQVTATIKKADLVRRTGDPDIAIKMLATLRSVKDPRQLLAVAEAYERYGDQGEAFTILKQIHKMTGSEDILAQVAWLSEENGQFDEAYEFWLKLWRQTKVPARRLHAKTRMLDLASRNGKLVDLLLEVEEKLDENRATHEEAMLLVDIYSQMNDPISASEVLFTFGQKFGNQVEAAKRLVRVYIDCDLFARADSQLRKLAKMDPENASEYLEQVAMLAVERGRPYDASLVADEINSLENASSHAAEFSAGVFELLGMHAEAADAYENALKKHPDHIEILLLWGRAMKDAGKGNEAVQRLLDIAKSSEKDDLFVIAIDGLLNLDANPKVLREALAMIKQRLADDWNKVFLYDLAIDVLDGLGESGQKLRILQQSLIAAGMRRPTSLRELMDEATLAGGVQQEKLVVDYGRILLTLGDEVPPAVFLQIGKAMVNAGDIKTAAAIFRRAGVHGDFADIGRRVAALYESLGKPRQAESMLHELLITEPDAIDLLIQAGGLSEQSSRFPRAFESYLKAVNLLLDRVSPVVAAQNAPTKVPGRYYRREYNVGELELHLENATCGLIISARTPDRQTRLVESFTKQTEEELAQLKKHDQLKEKIEDNPRLMRRIALLRRIAFSLHRPDAAARVDRLLIDAYPKDVMLRSTTIDAYLAWGYFSTASTLAESSTTGVRQQILQIRELLRNKKEIEKLKTDQALLTKYSRYANNLAPILLAKGYTGEVRRLFPSLTCFGHPISPAYVTANALDDPHLMDQWTENFLKTQVAKSAMGDYHFRRMAELGWANFSKKSRKLFLDKLAELEKQPSAGKDAIRLLRMELTYDNTRLMQEIVKDPDLLKSVFGRQWYQSSPNLEQRLAKMPTELRIKAIQTSLVSQLPQSKRSYLIDALYEIDALDDAKLADFLVEEYKKAPKMEIRAEYAYSQVVARPWCFLKSPASKAAAVKIAKHFAEEYGSTAWTDTLLGITLSQMPVDSAADPQNSAANEVERGRKMVSESLDQIIMGSKFGYQEQKMLVDLLQVIPESKAKSLGKKFEEQIQRDGATIPLTFAAFYVHRKLGNTRQSLDMLQKMFERAPDDRSSSYAYVSSMQKLGREVELIDLLKTKSQMASIEAANATSLADMYYRLYRFKDAIRVARLADTSMLTPLRIVALETTGGNIERAVQELRRFFIEDRKSPSYFLQSVSFSNPLGGMQAYGDENDLFISIMERESVFEALAEYPYAVEEWRNLLTAYMPDNRNLPKLIQGYAKALVHANQAEATIDAILKRYSKGVSDKKDLLLLLALQGELPDDAKIDLKSSADQLDDLLLAIDWSNTEQVTQLAQALSRAGQAEGARLAFRWVVGVKQWGMRNELQYSRSWNAVDQLIATYPEKERPEQMLKVLKQLTPAPLGDNFSPDVEKRRFDRLLSMVGSHPQREKILDTEKDAFRKRMNGAREKPNRDTLAILATLEASLDRFDEFQKAVQRTIDAPPVNPYRATVWNYRRLLPPGNALKNPEKYLAEVLRQLQAKKQKKEITHSDYVRAVCHLGQWLVENKVKSSALETEIDSLTKQVESSDLIKIDPESALWLVDYYLLAGDTDTAYRLSKQLFADRHYPPARFPWLFAEIEKRDGKPSLQKAIELGKTYSEHPILYAP